MSLSSKKLKEILVPSYVNNDGFESAVKEAEEKKASLETILVEKDFITDEDLGVAVSKAFGCGVIDLRKIKIPLDLFKIIPEVVAHSQRAIVFERGADGVKLALADPQNFEMVQLLEKETNQRVLVYYATPIGIEEALYYYKGNLKERVEKLIRDLEAHPQNEENVVKLANLFLEYAYDNRASDIHIEPMADSVSVRFRIDGILHEVCTYSKNFHENLVSRIKIMSRLRTDERAAAQDGRFDYSREEGVIFDARVSILPIAYGENVVIRLLAQYLHRLYIKDLGLSKGDEEKLEKAAKKPYGMILAAGPTGSGKTTSLYAVLQALNRPEVNIMTIEDPVEYEIAHVQQIQVNPKKDITFANGLRSIVRQDPDIIMVGEIRDNETAGIAVNAAMTGHLVLSTLHANDAATTFPRLSDMGVEPFLIASSVNIVIAQRLVRRTCEMCVKDHLLTGEELEFLETNPDLSTLIKKVSKQKDVKKIKIFRGEGKLASGEICPVCDGVGYKGRVGIFEVMEITDELRSLITQKAEAHDINKKAQELGMLSMTHNGIAKMLAGTTTLEEIVRVTRI